MGFIYVLTICVETRGKEQEVNRTNRDGAILFINIHQGNVTTGSVRSGSGGERVNQSCFLYLTIITRLSLHLKSLLSFNPII